MFRSHWWSILLFLTSRHRSSVRGSVDPFLSDPFAHMTLKNRVHEGKNKGLGVRWELAKDELATQDQQDWGVPGPSVGLSSLLRSLDKKVRARGG
uniref:Secreted protein n=1 Tax=Brassica oleracea var. oleracea TaxID=109376 RepID=A0A0D3CNM9_BRAOL